ncbi:MAG TPA: ATP-binding protein [Treponema sp.]|nr:ATP-binding protein [Treponema sp.]
MDILSFAHYGYEGQIIKVEADLRRGIPTIDIVGLPDGAVREARERMRAAVRNSGFEFPRERILINLSPADLKKEGSSFDLSIALAVLGTANGMLQREESIRVMVLGELELSGAVRPVKGVLAAVSRGLSSGIHNYIVPQENSQEAEIRSEARVFGVSNLNDAYFCLAALFNDETCDTPRNSSDTSQGFCDTPRNSSDTSQGFCDTPRNFTNPRKYRIVWSQGEGNFSDVHGQQNLVRALQIAAAGGHHLVAYGPPGSGKTLAIKRFSSLLPELDEETAVTVTRIHSLAGFPGRLGNVSESFCGISRLLTEPPFREPHPNASLEGITGGGRLLRPGEISLAHGGILFLDEAAQFKASALQALRTPLETGTVTVSRAGRTAQFPARFQLLMAMNPCPCGNYAAKNRICTCAPDTVEKYWKKLTAPLLDRIDIRVHVENPEAEDLAKKEWTTTEELRKAVEWARLIQWERNRKEKKEYTGMEWLNGNLKPEDIEQLCPLSSEAQEEFYQSMKTASLSGRGGHGIIKVARTIADMEKSKNILPKHLTEAASYRRWNGSVPDFL